MVLREYLQEIKRNKKIIFLGFLKNWTKYSFLSVNKKVGMSGFSQSFYHLMNKKL